LKWKLALRLDSSMISGVGMWPLRMPFLFYLVFTCTKDASVAAQVNFFGSSIQWNVSFVRAAHDWEVDVFTTFFNI
jgi:hypothetical protein